MSESLKIGLVLDDSLDKPDGVQQYILALGSWLSAQGHEVHYLVGETKRLDLPRVHSLSKNIGVRFNGNRLSIPLPTSRQTIRRLLSEEAFDVLHVQVPYSPFMAGKVIAAASPTTAVIGTFHILPNSRLAALANKVLAMWCHRSLKRFNSVVSVSKAAQRFAKDVYGLKTEVLPNVFDYSRFHSAEPFERQSTIKNVLFFGRLVPRKGCQLLLEAAAQLSKDSEVEPFTITICGKGPLLRDLQAYTEHQGLGPRVAFKGFIEEADKPRYYASADVAVFPSSGGESFGIVLLEAMASGRATVLAGNNPGYASVLEPQPDLLFDAHNAAELAQKLKHYLISERDRAQKAVWGAEYSKQFDTAHVGNQLLDIYKEALRNSRNVR